MHKNPPLDVEQMRQHARAITGEDDAIMHFRTPHDVRADAPENRHLLRRLSGRLSDPALINALCRRQAAGAGVHAYVAMTDGTGFRTSNMLLPLGVWIDDDHGTADPGKLPLMPTIAVQTSRAGNIQKRQLFWRVAGFDWATWQGIQERMISEHRSDPNAATRNQTLRIAGTRHLKDPCNPQLVQIVDELTSGRTYDVATISAAFPPIPHQPSPRSIISKDGTWWSVDAIRRRFERLNELLAMAGGRCVLSPLKPGDATYVVDWNDRNWWLMAVAAIHHATEGSALGENLAREQSEVSPKFRDDSQEALWRSLRPSRSRSVTMGTINHVIRRMEKTLGIPSKRGRPRSRPRRPVSQTAQPVLAWGERVRTVGVSQVLTAHRAATAQRLRPGSLKARLLGALASDYFNHNLGCAIVGSLSGLAANLQSSPASLRRALRELQFNGEIIKSSGAECSIPVAGGDARRGILIGLKLSESEMARLESTGAYTSISGTRDTSFGSVSPTRETNRCASAILQGGSGGDLASDNSARSHEAIVEDGNQSRFVRTDMFAPSDDPSSLTHWRRTDVPNPFHYAVTTSADRTTLEWWIIRDALYPQLRHRLLALEERDPNLIADTLQALRDLADSGVEAQRWHAAVNDAACAVVTSYERLRGRKQRDPQRYVGEFTLGEVPLPFLAREFPKALARSTSFYRNRARRSAIWRTRRDYAKAKDPG